MESESGEMSREGTRSRERRSGRNDWTHGDQRLRKGQQSPGAAEVRDGVKTAERSPESITGTGRA